MKVNNKLKQGVMDHLKNSGMISKDKVGNYVTHHVIAQEFKQNGLIVGHVEACKVCEHTGASLYDHKCSGLPPIPEFTNLGIF